MINIELTIDDAAFLAENLTQHLRHVNNELVHTDKRSLQADLARDVENLERLRDRVMHALEMATSQVAV